MLKASGVKRRINNRQGITLRESEGQGLGHHNRLPGREKQAARISGDTEGPANGCFSCAYVGDDLIDLPVMLRCGLAITVPAAPAFVKKHAHYVTRLKVAAVQCVRFAN